MPHELFLSVGDGIAHDDLPDTAINIANSRVLKVIYKKGLRIILQW